MWSLDTQIRSRASLQAESGFALPTVMLGLFAAFGLAAAMVGSSVSADQGVVRDQSAKSAFGVAEAGVSQALLRYNSFTATTATPCVGEGAGGQAVLATVLATGWCAPVTANTAGGSYSYSVRPTATEITIISTGKFNGTVRRVEVGATYSANPGAPGATVFSSAQVIGKDFISIGDGGRITADVATNGPVTVDNGGKLYCNEAEASSMGGSGTITCSATAPNLDLPPVDSTPYQTANDNALLTSACWSTTGTPMRVSLSGKCSLGVAGQTSNLYLCKMTIGSGKQLTITAGATVNVWFAPPSACAGETVPFVASNGSKFFASAASPTATLALLVSDSPTTTTMSIDSGGQWDPALNFLIYAPTSTFNFSSGPHIYGAVAGKSVTVGNGSSVTKTAAASSWVLPGTEGDETPHYTSSDFVECTPENAPTTPDSGC